MPDDDLRVIDRGLGLAQQILSILRDVGNFFVIQLQIEVLLTKFEQELVNLFFIFEWYVTAFWSVHLDYFCLRLNDAVIQSRVHARSGLRIMRNFRGYDSHLRLKPLLAGIAPHH